MIGHEVKVIEGAAWLWGKLAPLIIKSSSKRLASEWKKFGWDAAELNYRRRLYDEIATTRILGKQKPIPINDFYTDVYVHDRQSAFQQFNLSEMGTGQNSLLILENKKKRTKAEDLLTDQSRLYILGKPGAGKTTFLKHLALEACRGRIKKTPIFISLKEWSESGNDLFAFVSSLFDVCGFPDAGDFIKHILAKGDALVLFDGLDEVNQEDEARNRTTTEIERFAQKYSTCSFCLTCRIAANEYVFNKFEYVEIADFNKQQQNEFIDRWFSESPSGKQKFEAEWVTQDNAGIRELGATPLLLTLICLAFEETLSFPSRRVDLYQEALDALMKKWDGSRAILRHTRYRTLSLDRKRQLLSRVAKINFFEGNYLFPRAKLIDDISIYLNRLPGDDAGAIEEAENILEAVEVQHGLLVERARGIYSFSHLTLQEFFTARFIIESQTGQTFPELIEHASKDNRWREVFLMVASLLDDATEFISLSLDHTMHMAGEYQRIKLLLTCLNSDHQDSKLVDLLHIRNTTRNLRHSGLAKQRASERVKDSTFNLAAQLGVGHFGKPSNALHRARRLASALSEVGDSDRQPARTIISDIVSNIKESSAFSDYLAFSALIIEALRVASVTGRSQLENLILQPYSD